MEKVKECFLHDVSSLPSAQPLEVCACENEIWWRKYILRQPQAKPHNVFHFVPEISTLTNTEENSNMLAFFLPSPNHNKSLKKCIRTFKQQGVAFTCRLMLVQLKSCNPSVKFVLTLVPLFFLLHALWFVHDAAISGTGNRIISLSFPSENTQLNFYYFPNRNLFKWTKLFLTNCFQCSLSCSRNLSLFRQIHLDGKESDHNFGAVYIKHIKT